MNYNNQMEINKPRYHVLPDSFDARIQNKILAQDRTINDKCYLKTYVKTNKEEFRSKILPDLQSRGRGWREYLALHR